MMRYARVSVKVNVFETLQNGKWNDEVCTQVRPGFVCKAKKTPVSATQAPYQKNCPPVIKIQTCTLLLFVHKYSKCFV